MVKWQQQLHVSLSYYQNVFQQNTRSIGQLKQIQSRYSEIGFSLERIDHEIPGVSTGHVNLLLEDFYAYVYKGKYQDAYLLLNSLETGAQQVLSQQDLLINDEIERLQEVIIENREQIRMLLANKDVIPVDAEKQLSATYVDEYERLKQARKWIAATSEELGRRRMELATVQKKIMIDKSDQTLYMLEDGRVVFSMLISLGRPGWATKSGEFRILDKLGTVWSRSWNIWLPYWMGIYFAGPSENGIHGLPFDNSGRVYWRDSVGKHNITYGCVMPNDENMQKLYEWSEVGTPVSITL